MDADVHDDAHGAKGLGPQHAQLVVRILQVAELAHQTLGVERPSLSAARYRRRQALKATELGRTVGELRQLKMMSWYPLVIGGRDLAPQRKPRSSQSRVPATPGPHQLLRWPHVVHRRPTAPRRDHGLDPQHRPGK